MNKEKIKMKCITEPQSIHNKERKDPLTLAHRSSITKDNIILLRSCVFARRRILTKHKE